MQLRIDRRPGDDAAVLVRAGSRATQSIRPTVSPKAPRVTATELRRALHSDGWIEIRQTGSHVILEHPTKPGLVVVPQHHGTLHTGTIASALRQAGLTAQDLIDLL